MVTAVPSPYGQNAAQYVLTFNDDFNSFDARIWSDYRAVWESPGSPRNYAVEEGVLKIWPQRNASGNFYNRTIHTEGKWDQTYGYFEIEAKLPTGKGVWPAIWLLGKTQEIDIMESYPGSNFHEPPWGDQYKYGDANMHPVAYESTVWFWPKSSAANGNKVGKKVGSKKIHTVDLSAGFHKYGLKWEPNKQTFYFDGKEVFSLDVTMPEPMFPVLDLWYEKGSKKAPDSTTPTGKSNSFEINYVRAWQFK